MAKVINPLLSMEASGQVGKALVYGKRKGVNVVRIYTTPSNPQTLDQMANRAFLGGAGKVSKVTHSLSSVAAFVRTLTPETQTYNSYFSSQILGVGNASIEADKTAYNTVGNATVKGYFDAAATDIGLETVSLDGTANTLVPGGLALWAAYRAAHALGSPDAPSVVTAATEPQVDDFATALSTSA